MIYQYNNIRIIIIKYDVSYLHLIIVAGALY